MANHRREQIVAAVVTALTGLTTTTTHVYRGRSYPLQSTELPALLVYMGADRKQSELSQSFQDWLLEIKIEARVKSPTAQLDTTLSQISKEVTVALAANYQQGLSFVLNTIEVDAEEPEFSTDADQPSGRQIFNWQCLYRRSRTDPSA